MKLHRNIAEPVINALKDVFINQAKDQVAVGHMLEKNGKWGARDRRLAHEAVYELTRHLRRYAYLSGQDFTISKLNFWHCLAAWLTVKEYLIPEWSEFSDFSFISTQDSLPFIIEESVPDWLDKIGREELGADRWEAEMKAQNHEAGLYIRINHTRVKKDGLISWLSANNIESEALQDPPCAIHIKKRARLHTLSAFRDGWFEIQDPSSQQVAFFMDLKAGMLVVDVCAGAGGKSLHMADIMRNSGRILALDVESKKLEELQKRARKDGFTIIETKTQAEDASVPEAMAGIADRVLIDAPCSGLGVLKRNPDSKWKLTSEKVNTLRKTQLALLEKNAGWVRPGGLLIYATCSILPSENEYNINAFLKSNKNFTLVDSKTWYPSECGYDGFYMAKLIREN